MLETARCALYLAADGRAEAAEFAGRALAESRSPDWSRLTCERYHDIAVALCAIAYALLGRRSTARRLLVPKTRAASAAGSACIAIASAIAQAASFPGEDDAVRAQLAELEAHWYGGYAGVLRALFRKRGEERPADAGFAPAELAVLRSLASGGTPKTVAFERNCSVHTVRKHIANIVKKLGCTGYHHAVRVARERGLV